MKLRRLDLRSNKMYYKPKQDFEDLIIFYDKDENPVVVIDTVNKRLSGSFGGDWIGDFPISGAIDVDGNITATGTITAQEFNTELTNVSVIYQSGSTKFGDTADDIHAFTGSFYVVGDISGSNLTTGTIHASIISGSTISGSVISGSFVGDGSALTYDMATTTIYGNIISGSIISGSTISGSFVGDGSGLTNVGVSEALTDGKNIQDFTYTGASTATVALEDDINIENLTISSSVFNKVVISESGSTNFGNDINDLHTITGSVKLQNSIEYDTASGTALSITGLVAAGKLSGAISGSDILPNTSINLGDIGQVSASKFSGSFSGDGTYLTGITASASPGGPLTAVQFRDAGATSGSSDFTFNKTTGDVTIKSGDLYTNGISGSGDLFVHKAGEVSRSLYFKSETGQLILNGSGSADDMGHLPLANGTNQAAVFTVVNHPDDTGNSLTSSAMFRIHDDENSTGDISFFRSKGTAKVPLTVDGFDRAMSLTSYGYNGSKYYTMGLQEIFSEFAADHIGEGGVAGAYQLKLAASGSEDTLTTRFIVRSDGNIGLGENNYYPDEVLDVDGNQTTSGTIHAGGNITTDGNITAAGDVTVEGNLTAQQYIVSSSVTYLSQSFSSGSTMFGDTSDDKHEFTGSVEMSASLDVGTNITVGGTVDGVDIIAHSSSLSTRITNNEASASDHSLLGGLSDDDHTQYILADGTRPFTGNISGSGDLFVHKAGEVSRSMFFKSATGQLILNGSGSADDMGHLTFTGGTTQAAVFTVVNHPDQTENSVTSSAMFRIHDELDNSGDVSFWRSKGTAKTPTIVDSFTRVMQLNSYGYNGSNYNSMGTLEVVADTSDIGAGGVKSYFALKLADSGSGDGLTAKLVARGGGVGIGDNHYSPSEVLDVAGNITSSGTIQADGNITAGDNLVANGLSITGNSIFGDGAGDRIETTGSLHTHDIYVSSGSYLYGSATNAVSSSQSIRADVADSLNGSLSDGTGIGSFTYNGNASATVAVDGTVVRTGTEFTGVSGSFSGSYSGHTSAQGLSGSFSGSYEGDGSNLTNIPSSSTAISASTAASASYNTLMGFRETISGMIESPSITHPGSFYTLIRSGSIARKIISSSMSLVTGAVTASFAIGPSGSQVNLGGGLHIISASVETGPLVENLFHASASTFTDETLSLHITGSESVTDLDWTLVMERI